MSIHPIYGTKYRNPLLWLGTDWLFRHIEASNLVLKFDGQISEALEVCAKSNFDQWLRNMEIEKCKNSSQ